LFTSTSRGGGEGEVSLILPPNSEEIHEKEKGKKRIGSMFLIFSLRKEGKPFVSRVLTSLEKGYGAGYKGVVN